MKEVGIQYMYAFMDINKAQTHNNAVLLHKQRLTCKSIQFQITLGTKEMNAT